MLWNVAPAPATAAPAFHLSAAGCGTRSVAAHRHALPRTAAPRRIPSECTRRCGCQRFRPPVNVVVVGRALIQGEGGEGEGEQRRRGRRLIDVIRRIPSFSKSYFRSPFRRALYGGISLLGGFYVAQTISLSFGALGVNDVIAAVLSVLFTEYVTRFYHTRPRVTFPVALLNNFKMGFSYGLFIDAFKLAS